MGIKERTGAPTPCNTMSRIYQVARQPLIVIYGPEPTFTGVRERGVDGQEEAESRRGREEGVLSACRKSQRSHGPN